MAKHPPRCYFFARGRCRYGDRCRFRHVTPPSLAPQVPDAPTNAWPCLPREPYARSGSPGEALYARPPYGPPYTRPGSPYARPGSPGEALYVDPPQSPASAPASTSARTPAYWPDTPPLTPAAPSSPRPDSPQPSASTSAPATPSYYWPDPCVFPAEAPPAETEDPPVLPKLRRGLRPYEYSLFEGCDLFARTRATIHRIASGW